MAGPRMIKRIKGGVEVWDYRQTGILPANGPRIRPLIMVEHIPVIRQMPGLTDFEVLARVLRNQGLSLQAATDAPDERSDYGKVALYNDLDELCYQARGANSISCGVEHMHATINEPWSKRQLRASAWLWQYAEREYGIPLRVAKIAPRGRGAINVIKRGHTSHQRVSAAAGFHDRSDPGSGYDWEYVRAAAVFFKRKGHFEGV